ncbi:tetratricopeptide repeat protein [Quadrisphaera setariae]|uniref:Tetratricopeptide repeat protein n=1 Tax=Quadrisphaera setariae TaxID=2593304 RepID=A0A5C8Z3F4_9ACTN|nr:tetratricopeptide repeat protein [Quadrisphaera setariae]TXR51753.1 tetratricopeptide repeat protein [Quadrisphaera setariae]
MSSDPGAPSGGAYEWLQRGLALLASGDAEAAAVLLERANRDQPGSASVLEALARAQFDAGRVGEAASTFSALVEVAPDSDYARFGLGLSLSRLDRFPEAVEQLALAVAMRPDRPEYRDSLTQARATLRARKEATGG